MRKKIGIVLWILAMILAASLAVGWYEHIQMPDQPKEVSSLTEEGRILVGKVEPAAEKTGEIVSAVPVDTESVSSDASTSVPRPQSEEEVLAEECFIRLNDYRKQMGVKELGWNDRLAEDAKVRAGECVSLFSHTRPDGQKWYSLDTEMMYGENLAKNYFDSESVMKAWAASPGHNANMLDDAFTLCGIAVVKDGNHIYWAQEFY